MKRYFVVIGIVVFWANSMRLLIGREVLPAVREAAEAAQGLRYADYRRDISGPTRISMVILMSRKRADKPVDVPVGTLLREVRPSGPDGLRITTTVNLDVGSVIPGGALGPSLPTKTVSRTHVARGRLVTMSMDTSVRGNRKPWVQATGRVVGDKLNLFIRTGSSEVRKAIPFDPKYLLDSSASPLSGLPELRVGKRWTIRSLNVLAGKVISMQARVTRREDILWLDEELSCHVVEIGEGSLKSVAWVDDMRRIVKYKVMAFTFLLQRPSPGNEPRGIESHARPERALNAP